MTITITMEIPPEWLAEIGLQNFKPSRSAIRCAVAHELIPLKQIGRFVRKVPVDANGFRRTKMLLVLERILDDVPSLSRSTWRGSSVKSAVVKRPTYVRHVH